MPFINELVVFFLSLPLGMGIGGGGIFLVYLGDVLGLPREEAVFLNLIFFLCALLASAVSHLKAGRLSFPMLGIILLFGLPGALLGRTLASLLPPILLRVFLGLFLTASGGVALLSLKKPKDALHSLDKHRKKHYNMEE